MINTIYTLIPYLTRKDLIAILFMLSHGKKAGHLSNVGQAVACLIIELTEAKVNNIPLCSDSDLQELGPRCIRQLYQNEKDVFEEEFDDHGDSIHDPNVTKEQLDIELDNHIKSQRRLVRFRIPDYFQC